MKVLLFVFFLFVFGKEIVVDTLNGKVLGQQEDGVYAFRGIPFAEPPINQLRWKPPVPKRSWAPEILDARRSRGFCAQNNDFGQPRTEDCLYLNVYTPNYSNASLPVIINIHGGGFFEGQSDTRSVNGYFVAKSGNVVMVSMNYRLGSFGFAPFFGGNFGMMDQRLAFEWTLRNIKSFGGDTSKITLIGHSAGASSVLYHLVSKETQQFFHKVILMGNPSTLNYRTRKENEVLEEMLSSKLGCRKDDENCLRSKSTDDIVKAQQEIVLVPFPPNLVQSRKALTWMPQIDGKDITDQPIALVTRGEFKRVPIMIGNTKDEGISFLFGFLKDPISMLQYRALTFTVFGENSFRLAELYPPGPNDSRESLANIVGDYFFYCSSRYLARGFSKYVNTYLFNFLYTPKRCPDNGHPLCMNNQKSCHASECVYAFNTLDNFRGLWPQIPQEKELSLTMLKNLVDSDPNGWSNLVKYDSKEQSFGFNLTPSIMTNYKKEFCDFFDKVGYQS